MLTQLLSCVWQLRKLRFGGINMTLSPTAIALIAVLTIGYLLAVIFGTIAYFANSKGVEEN